MDERIAKRSWFRFSLRTLLLALIFLALAISLFFTSLRLYRADRELKSLRDEFGELTIDDPEQISVIQIPTLADLNYRWRIYLPPGRKFYLKTKASNHIPREGIPNDDSFALLDANQLGNPFVLAVSVNKNRFGKWQMSYRYEYPPQGGLLAGAGGSSEIADAEAKWLSGNETTCSEAGKGATESVPKGNPLTLLRLRKPRSTGGTDSQPTDGVMVWIAEEE